jgi:predicted adenylyl cyclase CyaB
LRNLEFKARLHEPRATQAKARELGAELWGDLRQTDTYFFVRSGRLKLRQTAGFQAELIYYERTEGEEFRPSEYSLASTPEGKEMREVLSRALGVLGVVSKRRTLLLMDSTRLHFDNVEGLGHFLEIEAPVRDDEGDARERIDGLLRRLGFDWTDCIRASYIDLVLAAGEQKA